MLSEVETTIGQRIRTEMRKKGISMRIFSRELNVTQPTVYKWVHDQNEPQLKHLKRIAEILNVSPIWLLYGNNVKDQNVSATGPAAMIISEDRTTFIESPTCLYYPVCSDEMEPTLKPGETAVVDRELQEFDQTGIYLVQVSGTRMLRRFRRAMDGSIRVSCDNSARYPEIETIESIEKLEVMGRVVSKVIVQAVN